MLQLNINNQPVSLQKGAKITFKLTSPLFREEIGYASQSFAFNLINDPPTRKALGFADMPEIRTKPANQTADVYFDGLPIHRGEIVVEKANPTVFRTSFLLDESAFSKRLKAVALNEIDLGGERIISTLPAGDARDTAMINHANFIINYSVDHANYTFAPIENELFYFVDATFPGGQAYHFSQNYWKNGSFQPPYEDQGGLPYWYNLTPFPYLRYVIDKAVKHTGYQNIHDTFWLDEKIASLIIYNNYALDSSERKGVLSEPEGDHYYYLGSINLQNHVPNTNAYEFIKAFKKMFNLAIVMKNRGAKFIAKAELVGDTEAIDWTDKTVSYEVDHTSSFERHYYRSAIDENDEAYLREIDARPQLIDTTVDFAEDLPVGIFLGGAVGYVKYENAYYIVDYETNNWRFYGFDYYGAGYEGADEEEVIIGTLQSKFGDTWDARRQNVPKTDLPGTTPRLNIGGNPFAPMLLFYNGIKQTGEQTGIDPDVATEPHPWANAYSRFPNPYSLHWNGDRGLYKIWHAPWEEHLENSKTVNFSIVLSFADLLNIQWEKKYRLRTWQGEVIGYFKELQYSISESGLSLINAEFIRV